MRINSSFVEFTRFLARLITIALSALLTATPTFALSTKDFPSERPKSQVYDYSEVLSRATNSEIKKKLIELGDDRIDARLITLRGLDYGVNINSFGSDLIDQWNDENDPSSLPLLLLFIDTQTNQTLVQVDPVLTTQLPESFLKSIAKTTMSKPLREGQRYRQASIDGINRISVVLNGGEDPGPPAVTNVSLDYSNVPSRSDTESSNGAIWVIGLLIIGTIVPMATWWLFSR